MDTSVSSFLPFLLLYKLSQHFVIPVLLKSADAQLFPMWPLYGSYFLCLGQNSLCLYNSSRPFIFNQDLLFFALGFLPLQTETEQRVTAMAEVVTVAVQGDPAHTQAIFENVGSGFMTDQIRVGQCHRERARNGIQCLKKGYIRSS
jgi:hypothetical protein